MNYFSHKKRIYGMCACTYSHAYRHTYIHAYHSSGKFTVKYFHMEIVFGKIFLLLCTLAMCSSSIIINNMHFHISIQTCISVNKGTYGVMAVFIAVFYISTSITTRILFPDLHFQPCQLPKCKKTPGHSSCLISSCVFSFQSISVAITRHIHTVCTSVTVIKVLTQE